MMCKNFYDEKLCPITNKNVRGKDVKAACESCENYLVEEEDLSPDSYINDGLKDGKE